MIKIATIEDLPKLAETASEFYDEIESISGFSPDKFLKSWKEIFKSGIGAMWFSDDYPGMLGAIMYSDINTGDLTAFELIWFVSKGSRDRGIGVKLIEHYEQWALDNHCKRIIMSHLEESMPDTLRSLYKRLGYKPMEVHYMKEVA